MSSLEVQPLTGDVFARTRGSLGIITLNRPRALNALSLEMVRLIDQALVAFAADPAIGAVVLSGGGGKAFCAGGDVRALVMAPPGIDKATLARDFFAEEYRLNRRIHRYAKPLIALIDGVTMGGGCGLSLHAAYVVATERSLVAMPETVLGLFPDVGATWFLNRCPGSLGLYLGLTGRRLAASDLKALGLATHVMASARLEALLEALAACPPGDRGAIERVLEAHDEAVGPAPIEADRAAIDSLFAAPTLEAVILGLEGSTTAWATDALHTIRRASPTSLRLTWRQLHDGRALGNDIEAILRIEYRLAVRSVQAPDFAEGVRAILVDKDNRPIWQPAHLSAVVPAAIDRFFAPFEDPADELRFEG